MVTETLQGLRDVDEVHGSFLLGPGGELLARDLPAVFDAGIFEEVGPRLVRLRETLEATGGDLGVLTLRFTDHKLHVRSVGAHLLGVLTSAKVNGPALRMAINLVARRVASHAGHLESEVPPEVAPNVPPPPARAAPVGTLRAPGVMGRSDISFRGRKL
ncbi:MAG TPA: roadblock/LC7 domain-containing protein [Polyangiaceae bacterium]|nr:roadblock/LC7 domain-containing protein [Polyangiaceae bacterium]